MTRVLVGIGTISAGMTLMLVLQNLRAARLGWCPAQLEAGTVILAGAVHVYHHFRNNRLFEMSDQRL